MRLIKLTILLLIAALNLTNLYSQETTDPAKPESLVRDQQLAGMIRQGEAKWLNDGTTDFLTLYCASLKELKGSLLWLTAPNQTVLSPGVLTQACDYLPNKGWQTLSITPSDLDFSGPQLVASQTSTEGTSEDSAKPAALVLPERMKWYEDQSKENLKILLKRLVPAEKEIMSANKGYFLVAFSASASLALEAINNGQVNPLAVIVLNIAHPNDPQQTNISDQLKEIKIPVLDIYSVNAKDLALKRLRHNRRPTYRQLLIPGIDSDYRGVEMQVLSAIENWLKKITK